MPSTSGGIPLSNYYSDLDICNTSLPRKPKISKDVYTTIITKTQQLEGKFLIMQHSDDTKDLNKTSPFLIAKGIDIIATGIKITKLRNSGTFLLETSNIRQTENLLKATTLGGQVPIKITMHPNLNTSKGLIYWEDLIDVEDVTLLDEMKSQKVIDIKRIKRVQVNDKKEKIMVNTPLVVLTFDTKIIPKTIKVAYTRLPVRMYIPTPMRCKRCQYFGHTVNRCKNNPTCARCSSLEHAEEVNCNESAKCVNCSGDHESFKKACPRYKQEYEVSKIKAIENVTYIQARKTYNERYPNNPLPTRNKPFVQQRTFANIIQNKSIPDQSIQSTSTNSNTISPENQTNHNERNYTTLTKTYNNEQNQTTFNNEQPPSTNNQNTYYQLN